MHSRRGTAMRYMKQLAMLQIRGHVAMRIEIWNAAMKVSQYARQREIKAQIQVSLFMMQLELLTYLFVMLLELLTYCAGEIVDGYRGFTFIMVKVHVRRSSSVGSRSSR